MIDPAAKTLTINTATVSITTAGIYTIELHLFTIYGYTKLNSTPFTFTITVIDPCVNSNLQVIPGESTLSSPDSNHSPFTYSTSLTETLELTIDYSKL